MEGAQGETEGQHGEDRYGLDSVHQWERARDESRCRKNRAVRTQTFLFFPTFPLPCRGRGSSEGRSLRAFLTAVQEEPFAGGRV